MACVLHSRPRGADGNMEGMWESRGCIAVQAANVVCMGSQGQEWFACSDKDCMFRQGGKFMKRLSQQLARRRQFMAASTIQRRLEQNVATEIWRRAAHMVLACSPP